MTTRRAIELCLSRLPMHSSARDTLAHHLSAEIRKSSPAPEGDVDAMRAELQRILSEASDVDASFSKKGLLMRLENIREIVRAAQ